MTACIAIPGLTSLLDHGAAVVRVSRRDKRPLGVAWNTSATTDIDAVERWMASGCNVGILLGHGNLIDVEYDDEDGRQQLEALGLGDAVTPTWASGRGEHRLFRLDGQIPARGWVKRGGLEIRIGGKPAQSVIPPSTHPTGRPYLWTISPDDCSPASITLAELGLT